jgi:prepilin signal peptidase PulO-like enzyme (type II secretory pathway)
MIVTWLYLFYATVFGVFFGSFLLVVVERAHDDLSWWSGRSMCPDCKKRLTWKELIPVVSFLVQKGACKGCKKKIPALYPLVELLSGLITFFVFYHFGFSLATVILWIIAELLLGSFLSDLLYMELPDEFSIPAIVLSLIYAYCFKHLSLSSIGIGVLIGAMFFMLQYVLTRGKGIGTGDIRLGIIMGALLGFPVVIFSLMIAYVGGSVVSLLLLATKKMTMKSALPLGVFLIPALVFTFVYEAEVIQFVNKLLYLNLTSV